MPRTIDDVKRRRALSTAKKLFSSRGFANTTFEDIAAESGVSKTTIINYFSTKEGIVSTIIEKGWKRLMADVEKAFLLQPDRSRHLEILVSYVIPNVLADTNFLYIMTIDMDLIPEPVEKMDHAARLLADVAIQASPEVRLDFDSSVCAIALLFFGMPGASRFLSKHYPHITARETSCMISRLSGIVGRA